MSSGKDFIEGLVNLTPHMVNIIVSEDDEGVVEILPHPDGAARIRERTVLTVHALLTEDTFSEVEGLPSPREGVHLIVSLPILLSVGASRPDVISPLVVRDNQGRVVGCSGFRRLANLG